MLKTIFRGTLLSLLLASSCLVAKEKNTEHTFRLGDKAQPTASIKDVAWLTGAWAGTAFGSQFEEVWNAASAGTMVGMFKVFNEQDGVSFYELMLIAEEQGSLVLKVKHFSADFVAWEEKDKHVSFALVSIEENAIHFAGLSFYRNADGGITAYVAITGKNGELSEEKLSYRPA